MQLLDEENDDCAIVTAGDESKQDNTMGATLYRLHLNGNRFEVTWQSATKKQLLTCDAELARFIQCHYLSDDNISTIHCCTEYMHNELVMRCHPSYQGEGPWFDWVSVHFEACIFNGKVFPGGYYPCKVMVIVPKQHNAFTEETAVVVQSAQGCTGNDSVLYAEWELMEGYHIVEPCSIVESLFVLELKSNKIAVVLSYSECSSCFTDTNY
jgi:hypothetical protein